MVNHVHLVLKSQDKILSKSMQSLLIRYVRYFNKKYNRIGPLFQCRFKSKSVENLKYFIDLCRYVHRNPEKAFAAKTQDYKWSSFKEYIGSSKNRIVNKDALLHYFNNNVNDFVNFTLQYELDDDIENFAEYELIDKLSDEQLARIVIKKFKIDDVCDLFSFFNGKDIDELTDYLKIIKFIKGTNITQVSRTLRLNRKFVEKVWNSSS